MFKLMVAHKFYSKLFVLLSVLALMLMLSPVLASCSSSDVAGTTADAESGQLTLRELVESIDARTEAIEGYIATQTAGQINQMVAGKDTETELAAIKTELAGIKRQLQDISGRIK